MRPVNRGSLATPLIFLLAFGVAAGSDGWQTLSDGQRNLAYCVAVLGNAAFGGERPGEDDKGSAAVLIARLAGGLGVSEAQLAATVLPAAAAAAKADIAAKGRPKFSAAACAGYAHFIKMQ
jgi:hypothetical protein